MSIEHVLPQTWVTHWALADGRKAPIDQVTGVDEEMNVAIARRRAALHTLGNLTLITIPGNTAASNSAFQDKKEWLRLSLLALNLAIIEKPFWDETTITARAESLADLAIMIWPAPDLV
jgi:hypothetical protein